MHFPVLPWTVQRWERAAVGRRVDTSVLLFAADPQPDPDDPV